ncbi:MAG: amidohydrolase family protein, partial [Cloacibacillus sp.]
LYLDLSGVTKLEDIIPIIEQKATELPEDQWIRAMNFNEANWAVPIKPDLKFMDSLNVKNPVLISRYCGHFHAVNSRGLKESGLWDKQDVNIPRNDDGSPKGQLTEGAAGEIIETISSIYEKPDNISALVEKACIKLASMGITMVHACDAPSYALGEDLAACQRLDEKDALPIRWACYHDELPNYQIKSGFGNEKLFVAGFKIFADGTLGGRTCAMREDFSDDPGNKGLLNHSDEEMAALLKEAQKRGVQVQIHTIGDKALEQTINSIKAVIAELGEPALPYRINHAIVCPADLLAKIKEINAVVDIQPIQAYTDRNMTPLRVGDERMKTCYSFKNLYDTIEIVTGSSDGPMENPNPWLGIWTAVNLTEQDNSPLKHYNRSQRLSLDEALSIYTVNPWKALGKGDSYGKIAEHYKADFTVIAGDPFAIDPKDLFKVTHKATFVDGELIWKA